MNRGSRAQYSRGGYNGRYNSSRGRGGAGRGGSRSTTANKGVFADGIWHCNCTPRLPAEHFKVKKEGKNQGRWFYTCQNQQAQRCDFFLWDEDAKLREEGAVLNNSRTEPSVRRVSAAQDGWDAGRGGSGGGSRGMFAGMDSSTARLSKARVQEDDESTDDESTQALPPSARHGHSNVSKRKAEASLDDCDDELLPWPLTGQEEQELVDATEASGPPETPRKAAKTGIYATPATTVEKKRTIPWLQESGGVSAFAPTTPTAATDGQEDYLDSPSKPSTKILPPIAEQTYGPTPTLQALTPGTHPKSPSPSTRHKDALANPADSSSSLTSEALAALDAVAIPPNILSNLRSVLSKHDLKTQGVVKGRDISRLALKAKEAKIVELQARIASLEAEREVDRGVIRGLRWEAENHVSDMAIEGG